MVEGLMNEESPLARVAVKRRKAPPPPPKPKEKEEKEEEKEGIWRYLLKRSEEKGLDWGGFELEEMSSMGAGAVEGGGVPNKKTLLREEEPEVVEDDQARYDQSREQEEAANRGATTKAAASVTPGVSTAATVYDTGAKLVSGDVAGAGENIAKQVVPAAVGDVAKLATGVYDAGKAFLHFAGGGRGMRGAGHAEGTPERTAYSIRNLAMRNIDKYTGEPGPVENVDPKLIPHLLNNPEVIEIAAEKGWISQNFYKRLTAMPKPSAAKVSENQIKNHEEPIVEEVLNYLLGKMEIL